MLKLRVFTAYTWISLHLLRLVQMLRDFSKQKVVRVNNENWKMKCKFALLQYTKPKFPWILEIVNVRNKTVVWSKHNKKLCSGLHLVVLIIVQCFYVNCEHGTENVHIFKVVWQLVIAIFYF